MAKLNVAVIGVGNMGGQYAYLLQEGKIENCRLAALTRISGKNKEMLQKSVERSVPVFDTADALFDAVEQGTLALDAVIIATPHYMHEAEAVRAFRCGLQVLSDKPAGAYSAQSRRMNEAADASRAVYAMMFQMRTNPAFQRMKELVSGGVYGGLKRVSWVVTDWYRPEGYFANSSWHSTWKTDGGGVLLNQCPHNLDILCWLLGTPKRVQGFCHMGKYHNIEVEDDVTAYLEWENGATGTFISSTGEAPGVNRLEISLEEAMLVYENGELRVGELRPELGMPELEYRASSTEYFRKINGTWRVEELAEIQNENPYVIVLQNFVDVCIKNRIKESDGTTDRESETNVQAGNASLIADGREGYESLLLTNAIYLSSWEKRMVTLPEKNSEDEKKFESRYERWLESK